ncbi:MAG TPA: ABC transporter permease [Vicinamibacterales bacterium]|nr:ABC transporter permease [Vicinamibacterales bacterium]
MSTLYRAALNLLPRPVRERHGEQMMAVFDDLVRDARRRRGNRGAARLVLWEFAALLRFAWCEYRGAPPPRRIDERWLSWSVEPDRRTAVLSSLIQDIRGAVRMLRHAPGFAMVCVATMALAIGANSAIFSVVNGVMLKELPYREANRIVVLGHMSRDRSDPDGLGSTTPGNYYDWQASALGFQSMAAFAYTGRVIAWSGNAERVLGVLSAGSIFEVLGRGAAQGRVFTAADDGPGAAAVVVLSSGLAHRIFGERPAVGETIGLDGIPFIVIGVMPRDFAFPDYDAQYWIPARFDAAFRGNRDQYFLQAVARLNSGVTIDQARTQLNAVMDAIRTKYPQYTQNATAGVVPMKDLLVNGVRTRLLTLMGAVVCILLIACANLGNLLLARASTRRREVAVRQALGARPMRLVRQMLTESVFLSTIGGLAGLALGYVLLDVLVASLPQNLPRANEIRLDMAVVAFTAAVSVAAGLAFGFFPAVQLTSRSLMEAVREGTRGSGPTGWIRTSLVVAELALALMLLAGAGLLVRSFAKLLEVNPGFRAEQLLTFRIGVPSDVYKGDQRVRFFEDVLARFERLPGVQAATMTSYLPVSGYGTGAWSNIIDQPLPPEKTPPSVAYRVIAPNYFQTMGIARRRGRLLNDRDYGAGRSAVVLSEAAARRFFPDQDPIGKHVYLGAPDNRLFPDAEIVGIVADVAQLSVANPGAEAVYGTHRLMPFWSTFSFAVRTTADPESLTSAIRAQVGQVDPAVPIFAVRTMDDVVALSRAPARSSMMLVTLFAVLAVVLAVIGVFGVLSYTISQRTRELGIRLALGASARNLELLVLAKGMLPVIGGVLLGLAGAFALTQFMESLLFGVTPQDPITFASVAILLTFVAALASYLPARRATRVDPVAVLRES